MTPTALLIVLLLLVAAAFVGYWIRLASAGGGRVFELGDIAALAADLRSRASRNTATVADAPATRWRDAGVWLLPLVLLFAALLSRRGWWA